VTGGGVAYCWGKNDTGQLGDSTTTQRALPAPVKGGLQFASVSSGSGFTCGLTSSGAAYCWGYNQGGQLGDGTTAQHDVPVRVTGQ
jgi:alpha-tubulin suppressor-like RCC1 family protein